MSNKQSSIEWLYNELFPKQLDGFSESEWKIIDKAFEQAKAMHKEEIKETARTYFHEWRRLTPEQYYKETFE